MELVNKLGVVNPGRKCDVCDNQWYEGKDGWRAWSQGGVIIRVWCPKCKHLENSVV